MTDLWLLDAFHGLLSWVQQILLLSFVSHASYCEQPGAFPQNALTNKKKQASKPSSIIGMEPLLLLFHFASQPTNPQKLLIGGAWVWILIRTVAICQETPLHSWAGVAFQISTSGVCVCVQHLYLSSASADLFLPILPCLPSAHS